MKTLTEIGGLLVIGLGFAVVIAIITLGMGAAVWLLWNQAFPNYEVTFWQAVAIAVLADLLFGTKFSNRK